MSKKHRHKSFVNSPSAALSFGSELESEYSVIKHDLARLTVINILFLAVVLALYYTNQSSHYLERWAARLF